MSDDQDILSLPIFRESQDARPKQGAGASHLLAAATGRSAVAPQEPASEHTDAFRNRDVEPARDAPASSGDWATTYEIRDRVTKRVTDRIAESQDLTPAAQQDLARGFIADELQLHNQRIIRSRGLGEQLSEGRTTTIAKAVYDLIYRLGPLQQWADDSRVENIDITGYDSVLLQDVAGDYHRVPSMLTSDRELIELVQGFARAAGREWTESSPRLHIDLPGIDGRLAALMPPLTLRPKVVIRLHRLVDVTLNDLVTKGELTGAMRDFLRNLVTIKGSVVVSGMAGTGKTTLLRALINEIDDPFEPIVLVEGEREIHISRMGQRHQNVTEIQSVRSNGEIDPSTGRRAGEYGVVDGIEDSLRLNATRIIVGEVRARGELDAMFQAMQAGAGSMSTIHAKNADDTIARLSNMAMGQLNNATSTYAEHLIAQHIDVIVNLRRVKLRSGEWRRVISEIGQVARTEERTATRTLFRFNPRSEQFEAGEALTGDLVEAMLDAGIEDPYAVDGGAR